MPKKTLTLWVVTTLITAFSVPAGAANLYWYLAASMSRPGREIVKRFNERHHPFTVILITGGSGQLLSKIISAGRGDLYTPAAITYAAKAEKLGLLKNYRPLIAQTPVFALSTADRQKIHSWSDLSKPGIRIGLGNPGTMALGKSYELIKKKMRPQSRTGIARNKVVEAVNVSQIISYLKANIIDAGIAFNSTAKANNLTYIEIPAACNHTEIAPLIRLKSEKSSKNSVLFTAFILKHMNIFKKYGFKPARTTP
ncbi:molybdate ABC transporter substrate-binding protein [Desulfobacterota bacterium M19]